MSSTLGPRRSWGKWWIKFNWVARAAANAAGHHMDIFEVAGFIWSRLSPRERDLKVFGLVFPRADHVVWTQILHIFLLEEYAPPGFTIDRGDIVVDIGANRGVFVAFSVANGADKVRAFEPSYQNFLNLLEFTEVNGLAQVQSERKAVSDREGHVNLFTSDKHTRHSIVPQRSLIGLEPTGMEPVEATTLDRILDEMGPVDLLKMDCEGAEFEIILGASDRTLGNIGRMIIEYHGPPGSIELRDLKARLRHSGFNLNVIPDEFGDPYGLVFARRDTDTRVT